MLLSQTCCTANDYGRYEMHAIRRKPRGDSDAPRKDQPVSHQWESPMDAQAILAILKGNLAPRGASAKGQRASSITRSRAARCSKREEDSLDAILRGR